MSRPFRCQPIGGYLFMACLWLSLPVVAQEPNYAFNSISPDMTQNAHSVVRISETVYTIENDQEATEERTYVVTILSPEGKFERRAEEYENEFQEVKYMRGRLFDAGGNLIRESNKNDVRDFSASDQQGFNDLRVKVLEMDYNVFPFTIEYKTKLVFHNFLLARTFDVQKLGQSVEFASLSIVTPNDQNFKWKDLNVKIQPQRKTEGTQTSTYWAIRNLLAKPSEPFVPFFREELAQIIFAPEFMRMGDFSGSSRTWNEVGHFFYNLNVGRDVLSPTMAAMVQQMTQGMNTREKVDVLYRYLQENYRYVSIQIGIGGWQTFPASFVEQKRYGDCKALTNFMAAMLSAAGIPSYQALVFAGRMGAPILYEDMPAARFNHVILYVPSEKIWLECTSNNAPTGYLGNFTAGRRVLLLTPDGGNLLEIPALTEKDNTLLTHAEVTLSESGHATLETSQCATGEPHDRLRELVTKKKQADIERDFLENAPFGVGKLHTLNVAAVEKRPEVNTNYQLETNNYAVRTGKRLFVPVFKTNPFDRALPATERRNLDLRLRETYTLVDTIHFVCPTGFVTENAPNPIKLQSDYGLYELQVDQKPDQIWFYRRIEIYPLSTRAVHYEEVRKFYQALVKADGAQMVLVQE